jgi:hypothetical protein
MGCAHDKYVLCEELEAAGDGHIDEETRGLIDAARRLNEVNRQLRNLIAANVSARLNALSGGAPLYKAQTGQALRPWACLPMPIPARGPDRFAGFCRAANLKLPG